MSIGSPTAYLLWAILSCIFLSFLVHHLWAYDRFNCLRWNAGRQPGAFKRVMTYSYIATLPMLVVFSVSLTAIKFREGYIVLPSGGIIPRPALLWNTQNRNWLLPLYFVLSIAWSFELVTHLEELTFWLFLLHQGPEKREWFHSWEFRTWYLGSMIAVLGMPLTTLIARKEIETAWIFLTGSSAGTSTTICFLYVIARFPGFIRHVKEGGAEPDVVVRLATFLQLHRIRVIFRFLFTIPLFIIALDGIHGPYPIISDPFALDFLLMMGGIGSFVSSLITLLIFFPRSVTHEAGYKAKLHSPQNSDQAPAPVTSPIPDYFYHDRNLSSPKSPTAMHMNSFQFPDTTSPHFAHTVDQRSRPLRRRGSVESELSPGYESDAESIGIASHSHHLMEPESSQQAAAHLFTSAGAVSDDKISDSHELPVLGKRRRSDGPLYTRQAIATAFRLDASASQHGRLRPKQSNTQLHPYVINFTSPIDFVDEPREGPKNV